MIRLPPEAESIVVGAAFHPQDHARRADAVARRYRMKAGADNPLVARLVAAHHTGHLVPYADALVPHGIAAAYATQAHVGKTLGAEVSGWKVGIRPDGTPMTAPIFADNVKTSGATWLLPHAGQLVVEVELALRLADDLPARSRPYSRDEVAGAVSEVLIGVELIHSRIGGIDDPPFLIVLADSLGNAGYVVGDALRNFRALDLARLRCRMTVDGACVHDRVGGHPQDDPYAPLIACLGQGMMGLGGFRAGQVITTGSLIVPLRPTKRMAIHAELEGIGTVAVTIGR
jgi:2-keto-4-pentenoate hydratase